MVSENKYIEVSLALLIAIASSLYSAGEAAFNGNGWMQYKAIFRSDDGSNDPVLPDVVGCRIQAPAANGKKREDDVSAL